MQPNIYFNFSAKEKIAYILWVIFLIVVIYFFSMFFLEKISLADPSGNCPLCIWEACGITPENLCCKSKSSVECGESTFNDTIGACVASFNPAGCDTGIACAAGFYCSGTSCANCCNPVDAAERNCGDALPVTDPNGQCVGSSCEIGTKCSANHVCVGSDCKSCCEAASARTCGETEPDTAHKAQCIAAGITCPSGTKCDPNTDGEGQAIRCDGTNCVNCCLPQSERDCGNTDLNPAYAVPCSGLSCIPGNKCVHNAPYDTYTVSGEKICVFDGTYNCKDCCESPATRYCGSKSPLYFGCGFCILPGTICHTGGQVCIDDKCTFELSPPITPDTPGGLIDAIIRMILILALSAGFIMILVAGFYIITSGGDTSRIKTGKDIILYTVIGLAIILFARALVELIRYIFSG